jgi:hypothetical protein
MNAALANLLLLAQAEQDPSVEAARRALDKWQWPPRYPWYDSAHDAVARIDVSEPWYAKWNLDWLRDWFDFGGFRLFSMSSFQWVAWIAIALLIGLVVYLLIRAYRRGESPATAGRARAGTSDAADDRRRVEALPLDGRKRSDFLTEAARYYEQGNYAEAIIYLFSHQLVELDKHELIHLTKGKTNRQYLRELSRRLSLRRLMEQTTIAFEDVFFGNHPLDRARFESCWSRLDEFNTLVAEKQ